MKRIKNVSSGLFVIAIIVTLAGGRYAKAIDILCCRKHTGACTTPGDCPPECTEESVVCTSGSCGNITRCCWEYDEHVHCADVAFDCCTAIGGWPNWSNCNLCTFSRFHEASEELDAEESVTWSEADEPEEVDSELTQELSEDDEGDEAEKADCEPADELSEDEWIMLLGQLIGAGR